jgi:hypothetical protein
MFHPRLMTPESVGAMDAYVLGDTFTDDEKEWLAPLIAALNSAAVKQFLRCFETSKRCGISVRPSSLGHGLFCGKKVGRDNAAALYFGILHVASRYNGRLDYAIELPRMQISPGVHEILYLCGFEHREAPFNAVMINHTCTPEKENVRFEEFPVTLFAEPLLRRRKFENEAKYRKTHGVTQEQIERVSFTYFIVVARVVRTVPAGGEFLVSYNQPFGKRIDHRRNYFMPRTIAQAVAEKDNTEKPGSDHILIPCMCEPAGCPGGRYFVFNRAAISQPAASSSPGAVPSSSQPAASSSQPAAVMPAP